MEVSILKKQSFFLKLSNHIEQCPLVKRLLEVVGVDTSIFTGHSVRGASSSQASNMGISTNHHALAISLTTIY